MLNETVRSRMQLSVIDTEKLDGVQYRIELFLSTLHQTSVAKNNKLGSSAVRNKFGIESHGILQLGNKIVVCRS